MFRWTSRIANNDRWRVDADGFLRVTMCVLRTGVFEYAKADLPEELTNQKPDLRVWRVRIPETAFTGDFLKTAEGKPVIEWSHEWQEAASIDKEKIVGAMAGEAKVDVGAMVIDGIIHDPKTIAAIKAGELVEISAGYHSDIVPLDGDPEADAVQGELAMNHVVLLPEGRGRCGPSVRILNAKETTMVKLRIKNAAGEEKEYSFTSENDANEASRLVKEQQAPVEPGDKQGEVVDKVPGGDGPTEGKDEAKVENHDLATAQAEFAKIDQAMKAMEAEKILLEQKIKQFESEEFQEAQAMERNEYSKDEDSLMENSDEETKGKLQEGLKDAKTMNARRKVVTSILCNAKGIQYDEQNAKLLFGVLVKTLNKKTATEIRKPVVSAKTVNHSGEAVHPIFARKG